MMLSLVYVHAICHNVLIIVWKELFLASNFQGKTKFSGYWWKIGSEMGPVWLNIMYIFIGDVW